MTGRVTAVAFSGIEARLVDVQVQIVGGGPVRHRRAGGQSLQ